MARGLTTAITGLRSGDQPTRNGRCPLKQIRVHGMVGLIEQTSQPAGRPTWFENITLSPIAGQPVLAKASACLVPLLACQTIDGTTNQTDHITATASPTGQTPETTGRTQATDRHDLTGANRTEPRHTKRNPMENRTVATPSRAENKRAIQTNQPTRQQLDRNINFDFLQRAAGQRQQSPVCEAATNYPSLNLPAEANPRAWHGWTPFYKSPGLSPVAFAIRANIRGPISSLSWKEKT
ncbi:MAG: hypothetical protein K1Y36_28010 [Blastocatellia bacterium]|nr:hypothetical protein [Blastocatellia bacterium]